jgi:hypothetical protein
VPNPVPPSAVPFLATALLAGGRLRADCDEHARWLGQPSAAAVAHALAGKGLTCEVLFPEQAQVAGAATETIIKVDQLQSEIRCVGCLVLVRVTSGCTCLAWLLGFSPGESIKDVASGGWDAYMHSFCCCKPVLRVTPA